MVSKELGSLWGTLTHKTCTHLRHVKRPSFNFGSYAHTIGGRREEFFIFIFLQFSNGDPTLRIYIQ